jgi:ribosomal protein S18 acetylase RimI-like enzyme
MLRSQESDSDLPRREITVSSMSHPNPIHDGLQVTMHPLDNVIWQALTTRQGKFAQGFDQARRFIPEVTSLTAFTEPSPRGYASLASLVDPGGTALLSLTSPHQPMPGWDLVVSFPGLQMVCEENSTNPDEGAASSLPNGSGVSIVELGSRDSPEMIELAELTKPGPFASRTHELGTYVGIRSEGKLVAMAGERLKVPGYTEVSAVCTHPEHTGKGYARVLMLEVMRGIRQRAEIPFLHVRQTNTRAVELYERLGFRTRIVVQFTVLRKVLDNL